VSKPEIDLKNPLVSAMATAYGKWATRAVDLAASRDDCVRPIYALDERTKRFTQVGSGVLFTFGDQVFCLSASHVFDAVGAYQLAIGCGNRIHSLAGDRFSTKRGASGSHSDDPIDASVFHMNAGVPPEVRSSALVLSDLDVGISARALESFVVCGYRVAKSRSTPAGHSVQLDRYPTLEADDSHYDRLKRDRQVHVVLGFEDHVAVDGGWRVAPSLRGMSGGAIFRVTRSNNRSTEEGAPNVRLAATLIERVQKLGKGFFSVAVGTRLGVHFGLIQTYLPELRLDEAVFDEYHRQQQDFAEGT
jgi:hypothetical protein